MTPSFSVEYFSVDPNDSSFAEKAEGIVRCYQLVFGTDSAWNEGLLCKACSRPGEPRKWNLVGAPTNCPKCREALEPFWPKETVLDDMRRELVRNDAVCAVLRRDEEIIGASWGYSATAEELEEHLGAGIEPEVCAPNIAKRLHEEFPGVERFAYQDEIFLLPEFQGRGFGKQLFAARHRKFAERGLGAYVFRTKRNPPSRSFIWFHDRWGYIPIAAYPDADERVILANSFNSVARHL